MSGQSAKRLKTTPSETQDADQPPGLGLGDSPALVTVKNQGLGQFEHIPPELLEVVLGSLDVRTLCTARLICRPFLQAASRHLHYLRLSASDISSHLDTNLRSFPDVRRLTVSGVQHNDLGVLEHPNLSPVITNVSMTCEIAHTNLVQPLLESEQGDRLPPLPPLPSLTSLTVLQYNLEPDCVIPATLRELVFDHPAIGPSAQPLLRLTQLTYLRITILHERHRPFDALTTLHGMRRLEIKCRWSFLPTVAKFPHLTYLDWTPHVDMFEYNNGGPQGFLGPLTSLQMLVNLRIGECVIALSPPNLAAIGQLTSLRSLDLVSITGWCSDAPVPAFQLTRLGINCLWTEPVMRGVRMEELQDLRLADVISVRLPDLAQATSLTQLMFEHDNRRPKKMPWFPTFGGMSRLQALTMQAKLFDTSCAIVLGALTGLTRLTWEGGHITNADVSACAALRQLRNLYLLPTRRAPGGRIRREVFMALAKRPQLTILELSKFLGIKEDFLTDQVKVELNSERHSRGWPPLAIDVDSYC